MKYFTRKKKDLLFSRLLFSLVLWLVTSITYAKPTIDEDKAVYPVIYAGNGQTEISRNGLSAIFKMRLRKWNDGNPVTVFVLKDEDPLHIKFSKQVLNVFPHQLRRAWNKAVFSGSGQAPRQLESIKEMIEKISNTPGAIGYLYKVELNENIKILTIR